ncbi:MAG: VCBS repeat-containing protein, partial [Actinobacteria bacterium]|nr:VCBS repeat-containing protein [Actinomycetota bacterium]
MRGSSLLVATMLAAASGGAITFAAAEQFPTGSSIGPGPGAVTTIAMDVDTDGDIDVVTTDWFGNGPLVLRNAGAGAFGPAAPIAGADDVGALAAGDVNGDGRPDLVGRDGNGVVILTANGDGTFTPRSRVAVSANAQQSVAVVDTNGDGKLDVVTPQSLGLQSLLGAGDGTFTAGPVSPLVGLLADIKPANLDGDGLADVIVADATPLTQRVVALRGTGDGAFIESGSGPVGYGPEGVLAGDLDGDGHDDAVSVDSFSVFGSPPTFSITVLRGDGRGGFGPPTKYATGDGPVSGALADFNGDGRLDVAVSAVGASVVT